VSSSFTMFGGSVQMDFHKRLLAKEIILNGFCEGSLAPGQLRPRSLDMLLL
jgi:hypothetical protein